MRRVYDNGQQWKEDPKPGHSLALLTQPILLPLFQIHLTPLNPTYERLWAPKMCNYLQPSLPLQKGTFVLIREMRVCRDSRP